MTLPTEHLESVADVYRAAYAKNHKMVEAVASHFGLTHQKAASHIKIARSRGILEPYKPRCSCRCPVHCPTGD